LICELHASNSNAATHFLFNLFIYKQPMMAEATVDGKGMLL